MWRRVLFRLKERWVHPHLKSILSQMRQNSRLSRDQWQRLHQRLIVEVLQQAAHCPYYARIIEQRNIDITKPESLSEFPVVTKREIEENLDDMVNPFYRGRLQSVLSSGSTGVPGRVLRSKPSLDWGYGAGEFCKERYGVDPAARTLRVWGAGHRFSPSLRKRIGTRVSLAKNRAIGVYYFYAYDISAERVQREWPAIVRWKPQVLHGYTTALFMLAQFVQESQLDGRSLGLKLAISDAEKLYPAQRALIEEVFGCPVAEWYGCCEIGIMATPCTAGRLHVQEDMVHLEIVDGSIVATVLRETGMPLIRYNLADEGELDHEPCSCGLATTVLQEVTGRTIDVILGVDGRRIPGEVIIQIVHELRGVRKYQVKQKARDRFLVQVEISRPLSKEDKDRVVTQFRQQLGGPVTVDIEVVDTLPNEKSGKFRWLVSELGRD